MEQINKSENRPDLVALYRAKFEAVVQHDLEALHEINNRIFYAKLNPADPDYEAKVTHHKLHEREYAVERKAKKVIEKSGRPLDYDDKLDAINGAIEEAIEVFEMYPCPQHAADLLGLIECRTLLYASTVGVEPDTGEVDS